MENQRVSESDRSRCFWPRVWPWLVVLAVLLFVGCIRLRLLNLPLERDEGEYAYAGQLLLQGTPPYELAYNMKLPGTYAAYAVGMGIFGQTTAGIHLTLLVAGSLTITFVFLLGRHLGGSLAGAVASVSYGIMSVSPMVAGMAAHSTHFVVLFAVPATWLLLRGAGGGRGAVFTSGLLFGMAFLMKQQGICFGMFGIVFLLWTAWRNRVLFSRRFVERILIFGTGLALPFAITCLLLAFAGVFSRFWFWTVSYARLYETALTLREGIQDHLIAHLKQTRDLSGGLWLLALAGLLAGWRAKPLRPAIIFTVVFWLFSFLGTGAGLYFRGHYFILVLPAFALLTGLAVAALREIAPSAVLPNVVKSLPVIAFSMILSWMIYYQAPVFFQWPTMQVCRNIYRDNPFAEAVVAAAQIREHSAADARVAVIGSEPEIYFYARRHSATGYIYTYALMEPQPYALDMQHEMAHEIEAARPEYLIHVPYELSWLHQPGSSGYLAGWFVEYSRKYYKKIGIVSPSADAEPVSFRDAAATNAPSAPGQYITIYQRLPDGDAHVE